ncbi:short-chain dehydrogenase [Sphingobium sp. C100]|uniref:SDR family NAD(P)-dependent oxidoreductase n=1 Tax=Sphingobium sp. C100 TaxID=1207055 RepID=UPI0003D5DE99|nr:SDR family NAD(P)-dependent oxidoreductase [Sphingobium sp. C100]ETI63326.1 short-chain dehydrogenase [Sphingobium sp. C100]PHQ63274.1 MAG: hypothetical protein COC10_07015 [Sphingobium sp.]
MNYGDFPFRTARAGEAQLPVLQGKTAIVTGAGTALGRGIARRFASEGANVIVAEKDAAAGEETVMAIEAAAGQAALFVGDPTSPDYHLGLVRFARHRYGWLDIAVNNAGINTLSTPLMDMSQAAWDQITTAHLSGIFHAVRAQIPTMIQARGGVIVNVAGLSAPSLAPAHSLWGTATQGLAALTASIASDHAKKGIRANAIISYHDAKLRAGKAPAGTDSCSPSPQEITEIAEVVLFLASAKSNLVSGTCVPVECGPLVS